MSVKKSVNNIQQLVAWSAIQYLKQRDEQLKELEQELKELREFKRKNWCIVCDNFGISDEMIGMIECGICKNMSHELCLTRFRGDGFWRHVCNNCAATFGTHCSVCNASVEWDNGIGGYPGFETPYRASETAFTCCMRENCQSCRVGDARVICNTCRSGARCVMAFE
jgi:hypothetical protein